MSRMLAFFAFWLVLAGIPADAGAGSDVLRKLAPDGIIGGLAAAAATWVSLRLLSPESFGVRLSGLPRLALHFIRHSVVAGVDVALRAMSPRLPLNPGFVEYRVGIPAGPGRDVFTALTSLLPGTLPVGTGADGVIRYHCLDVGQPVARQLAADEAVLTGVLRPDADVVVAGQPIP
ncbi:MAG: Na+/H+ antiporter subunit E [Verrucomicrobiae bacterium]|nr:Na+/H+ antiporter subunit E [Verrucomicrobiae bacterium]